MKSRRKSGNLPPRQRNARKKRRDVEIYRILRRLRARGISWHNNLRRPIEPLSVYMGLEGVKPSWNRRLAPFPKRTQENGRPMPHWDDLTLWLKVQLAVMLMDEWSFQTFNIHIHPKLEAKLVAQGRDVRAEIRDRLRKELAVIRPGLEHFFVIEGWSKLTKAPTILHIHGGALIDAPGDGERIKDAAMRAAGQGIRGHPVTRRAKHGAEFTRAGPRYVNYLFKSVRRHDDRLEKRRLTMSRSIVDATRDFWHEITGRLA
jgi:hypothetical protein